MCPVTDARFLFVGRENQDDDEAKEAMSDSGTNLFRLAKD